MANYNDVFPATNINFELVYRGYYIELEGLIRIVNSTILAECIEHLSDIRALVKNKQFKKSIRKLFKKTSVIDINNKSEVIKKIFYMSHLAVCAELFKGMKIPVKVLKPENIDIILTEILGRYRNADSAALNDLDKKLHSVDAVRTMYILRFLGLISDELSNVKQLSLGAGSAEKDIYSIHLESNVSLQNNSICFESTFQQFVNVVVIDGDPQRKEQYEGINKRDDISVLAINDNTYDALKHLPEILEQKNYKKRNLVVALRIDYRMFPDVKRFFSLLKDNIDEQVNLIITIGSGFDVADFKGRVEVLNEFFVYLKQRTMNPILIKLHGSGTIEEQRNSHAFSMSGKTTYEILYCCLKKGML